MDKLSLGFFNIDQSQSDIFGETSGDRNPLHLNPVVARRYQFGSTVIHGMYGTLMALELFAQQQKMPWKIEKISVQYNKPIRQGDEVEVLSAPLKTGGMRIELMCRGKRSQLVKLHTIDGVHKAPILTEYIAEAAPCVHLSFEQANNIDTEINLVWNKLLTSQLFPNLIQNIPHQQMSLIMGLTNIVGMKCPGLNSVFGGFELNFNSDAKEFPNHLNYQVSSSDERFSRIMIAVEHPWAHGCIEALFRAEPIKQPSFLNIKNLVAQTTTSTQFENEKALIVGGSRGLGEITAKIIASGKGEVIVSYTKGKDEAQKIVEEIIEQGGQASTLKLDVMNLDDEVKQQLIGYNISQVYYFASPLIEKSGATTFNFQLFDRFCRFYLQGFTDLLNIFMVDKSIRNRGLHVFVPSTTFITEQPDGFGEYIAAKAAVEIFSQQFVKKNPTWSINIPRLPRLPTDQTAAVVKDDPMLTAQLLLDLLVQSKIESNND